jgi:hypothetical protein
MILEDEMTCGNVRLVHEEAIKPDSIYAKRPLGWFVGRCVKMAFQSADSLVEHMWVLVTDVDGTDLVGVLSNEPVLVHHVRYGDNVTLNRTTIEAVNLSLDEWREEVEMLKAKNTYVNKYLGSPQGDEFEEAYGEGLTPRQALNRWKNFGPVGE